MDQIVDFFRKLFDTSDFPARWNCGRWTGFHGWLYITSDLLVWSAYFAIPLIIVRYVARKKNTASFHPLYILFAAFILACGTTHLLDAIIFYTPVYRLSAVVRLLTGMVSWVTVFYLIKMLPVAFSLRSPKELEHEIEHRKQAEQALRENNAYLTEAQKIARIAYYRWDLNTDSVWINETGYEVFGLDPAKGIQLSWIYERIIPDDRPHLQSLLAALRDGRSVPECYCRITAGKQGHIRHLLVKADVQTDRSGRKTATGIIQDVTRDRRNLEKIQRQNQTLREIAWIQSHDVRGPVATILGLAALCDDSMELHPDTRVFVEGMKTAALDLDKIIHTIVKKTDTLEITKA